MCGVIVLQVYQSHDTMKTISNLISFRHALHTLATEERRLVNMRFFKTGIGEYGEGDIFLGITVPDTRRVVKQFLKVITLPDAAELLHSKYHEERLAGLMFLTLWYTQTKDVKEKKRIFTTYIKHTKCINNWDLVDTSASYIVGDYISEHMKHEERLACINRFIESKSLWENRIIVVATHYQIKKGNEKMLYYVAPKLLNHPHDLMHKAIGWMLREVGKYSGLEVLNTFLDEYASTMSRTTLRYALERHGEKDKKKYMAIKVFTRK